MWIKSTRQRLLFFLVYFSLVWIALGHWTMLPVLFMLGAVGIIDDSPLTIMAIYCWLVGCMVLFSTAIAERAHRKNKS